MTLNSIYIIVLLSQCYIIDQIMAHAAFEQLNKKLELLLRELDSNKNNRKNISISHTVGGSPESKHLDGSNYNDWKFWMDYFLVNAGLWKCVSYSFSSVNVELDKWAFAKINFNLKPCAAMLGL